MEFEKLSKDQVKKKYLFSCTVIYICKSFQYSEYTRHTAIAAVDKLVLKKEPLLDKNDKLKKLLICLCLVHLSSKFCDTTFEKISFLIDKFLPEAFPEDFIKVETKLFECLGFSLRFKTYLEYEKKTFSSIMKYYTNLFGLGDRVKKIIQMELYKEVYYDITLINLNFSKFCKKTLTVMCYILAIRTVFGDKAILNESMLLDLGVKKSTFDSCVKEFTLAVLNEKENKNGIILHKYKNKISLDFVFKRIKKEYKIIHPIK